MIEFLTNHHGARIIEKACQKLVQEGAARCIKDSREGEFETERYINDASKKDELENRNFGVVVYSNYMIKIGDGLVFRPYIAKVRIWYAKSRNSAGIKISEDDLMAIAQSTTVISLLHKLDVSLGGNSNGEVTLDKVAAMLTKTITKIDPRVKTAFTAQKTNNRR